ncbi:hypothetical protein ACLOJK_026141 [Asimina triloba]
MDSNPTKLAYFDDTHRLESTARIISHTQRSCNYNCNRQAEDGRAALIFDSTIFHPQGGGQPFDTGFVTNPGAAWKFVVEDVRLKDGVVSVASQLLFSFYFFSRVFARKSSLLWRWLMDDQRIVFRYPNLIYLVFHYGYFDASQEEFIPKLESGQEVYLHVDEERRKLNSRNIFLFGFAIDKTPFGRPFVEYKGSIPQNELQNKQKELEIAANALISEGGKVSTAVLPYEEASEMCGGSLPTYISKEIMQDSSPRIVKIGKYPGCPCGGTHVADIVDIGSMKLPGTTAKPSYHPKLKNSPLIRVKKGLTKVSYSIFP